MSLPNPTHETLLAKVARATAPSYGWCHRCGMPWKYVEGHCVDYSPSSGCFPLCEGCWDSLTPEERLPYYEAHVQQWGSPEEVAAIRAAILGDHDGVHDLMADRLLATVKVYANGNRCSWAGADVTAADRKAAQATLRSLADFLDEWPEVTR